jgi:hypothetical protein
MQWQQRWKLGPEKDFVVCLVFMGKCWKLGSEKDFVGCLVFMGKCWKLGPEKDFVVSSIYGQVLETWS